MPTKNNKENTTARYQNFAPGSWITVGGVTFAILEERPDGSLFVVAISNQFTCRFGQTNNYIGSDLREATEEWLKDWVEKNGFNWAHIIPRDIDLTTLDGHKYGVETVTVAPLTLDEFRQYAKIIPKPDIWSWLATGWGSPSCGATYALSVNCKDGCGKSHCSDVYGVRPALVLSPDLFSAGPDADDTRRKTLCSFTTRELLEELYRRCGGNEEGGST